MLINSSEKYVSDLFSLWQEAFGDETEYINLFFETVYKNDVIIFAAADKGKIVSVLYLMEAYINNGNKTLSGYYLYAAATDASHRGKGLMGGLIEEAKEFAIKNGKDFISLVPGSSKLYGYYEKFGFKPIMYKGKQTLNCTGTESDLHAYSEKISSFFENRSKIKSDYFHHFSEVIYSYAEKCYEYSGLKSIEFDNISLIFDIKNRTVNELLCSENAYEYALLKISKILPEGEFKVYSPFGKEKEPYGMVWFSKTLKFKKNIYMNIALD